MLILILNTWLAQKCKLWTYLPFNLIVMLILIFKDTVGVLHHDFGLKMMF